MDGALTRPTLALEHHCLFSTYSCSVRSGTIGTDETICPKPSMLAHTRTCIHAHTIEETCGPIRSVGTSPPSFPSHYMHNEPTFMGRGPLSVSLVRASVRDARHHVAPLCCLRRKKKEREEERLENVSHKVQQQENNRIIKLAAARLFWPVLSL